MSVFLRSASRWFAVLGGLFALGFSIAAGLMFFWVLPNISEHRDTVADMMSRALGQRVTMDAVSGVWQQSSPEFRLQGVRLYDKQNRLALYLPEIEATFAWRSLLFLEPRFKRIELQGLTLDVRRARDKHFYVGGIPVNPADPDSGFSSWMLRQGQVHVGNATLNWLDEVRNAPPLVLEAVDFTLINTRSSHTLKLSAIPPASLAKPLTLNAEMNARDVDDMHTWRGRVEANVAGVSLPHLATWLQVPYQPYLGWGALQVMLTVSNGALTGVTAGLDLRSIETTLGADLPALQLGRVSGQVLWQRESTGQQVAFENLRIARAGATLSKPFNVGLAWNDTSREVTAQALSLSGWESVLPSLPMDEALRARLQTLKPQGRLDSLRFRWRGAQPTLDNFSVASRFTSVGVDTLDQAPGLSNLSGHIEGDARAGVFEIDSRQMRMNLPALFREPLIELDEVRARGSWKKTARGRLLVLDEAAFSNRDAAGTGKGRYEWIVGQPGIIDLNVHLTRAEGTAVYRYLPSRLSDRTVGWAREAVIQGHSNDVKLILQGDLRHFPFEHGNGRFMVDAQIKDAVIDYVPGWPRIEGIQARMVFKDKRMEVTSNQASIYGVGLSSVIATIPDLVHHEEQLHITGIASGPFQDFVRFANTSPVGEHLYGLTPALITTGPMRLALTLHVPLRASHDTTLEGALSFADNTAQLPGLPKLGQIRGVIDFTHAGLSAKNMTAQFLGGPLRVDTSTRDDRVQIQAQGRATAAGLADWLGPAWGKRMSGQTAWRGLIDLSKAGERVRVESDLVGLGLSLPAPLAKPAASSWPLLVTSQPQAGGRQNEVRLARVGGAVWRSVADAGFAQGEVRFGGQAVLPSEPGLRLAGSGSGLDITGWMNLLPDAGRDSAIPLSSIDLGFDAFDLMGRRFQDVRLQGRNRGGMLRMQVSGRDMSGALTYRPAGEQPARVSLQFKQLTIPDATPGSSGAKAGGSPSMNAEDFPMLDLVVEDFRLQSRPMGRLEAVARGSAQGLLIDNLQLTHPDSVFRMSGLWRDSGISETRSDLSLKVLDVGKFLTRFGFPDTLKRGTAEVQGNATWEGSPADFAFGTLAGELGFKAQSGQFLKVDPGVAKLLGVLSLQSLPRRLNFDFRDIFNEGYAFDSVGATLRITRGVVYSDDFKMRGPSAKVNMSGLADLNQESVQLRAKVIPKLSESVAVAGALIGGPLAGIGALAAQKLLRDPFEEAISQEYMVTGAWVAPDVKKLTKSKAQAQTQVTEP